MSIVQKDISNLESQPELPDTYLKEGDFLRVKTDGSGDTEWFDTNTGSIVIGTGLFSDGSVTNPSIAFQSDTNTGIYRVGADDIGITTNGVQRLDVNNNIITAGTVANPISLVVNGTINSAATTVATGVSWNNLGLDSLVLNTGSADFTLTLNGTGTTSIGRKICFYKSNTANNIIFTATDGVAIRLTGPFGTQLQTNASYTHVPSSSTFTWLFEITRTEATNYQLTTLSLTNGTNSFIQGNVFRAGNGTAGTPSFSFTGDSDTGMYFESSAGSERLRFSINGNDRIISSSSGTTQILGRINADAGTVSSPSIYVDTATGIYRPTLNQLAISNNGVQNTNFTTTGVDIGLNNVNNTNLKTLTQNGASNFNTFTPSYSSFLLPQTAIGTIGQSLSGVDFDGTNYVVSISGTAAGNRLWVSSNLSTWTAISDTQISLGNSQVQFGNGIWCYLSRTNNAQQLWTSTSPATTWTQIGTVVPWTTARQANRLKFINGQFIVLMAGSIIRFSSNGTSWTEYSINATSYTLNDIAYSPELQRYIIVTGGAATLYFSGNTITNTSAFTAVTTNVETANCCSYSPKYGLFLYHGNGNNQRYYISRDGINWTFYINPTTVTNSNNTIWINDFGGFFLDMQFNQSQVAVSRDGLSFQVVSNNLTLNSVNCVYNSTGKVLLIVGSTGAFGTFRNLLTDFNNYVDSDNIYNTFTSNTRFADTIEYQNQVITTATGNNHFTISSFNRPEVVFDTTSVNANIYLQGASFNGRVGCKFKFIKSNSNNNVRIHGYETTTLISPTGNVNSFNAQSSPQTYSIIPAGYFGSFELTRVSDAGNGVWVIDNVDVYDSTGTSLQISNLNVSGNLTVSGSISGFTSLNNANLTGTSSFERVVYNSQDLFGTVTTSTVNLSHHYVKCYTNSGNVSIELGGSTGNNTAVGTRFKFQKMDIANIVRLSGSATTSPAIQTPMVTVSSFTNVSSPNVITIIPANYLGSFELVRIDTNLNGNWRVENLQIFNASAQTFLDTNLIVNKNLTSNGTLLVDSPGQTSTINHNLEIAGYLRYPIEDIKEITWNTGYDVKLPDMLSLGKYNYFISAGSTPSIYLQNINNQVYDNFTFNFCIAENGTTSTNYQIQNDMGGSHIVKVYKSGAITTLTATQTTTIDMHQWTRCTYKHNYRSGNNYWLVHHYNSNV